MTEQDKPDPEDGIEDTDEDEEPEVPSPKTDPVPEEYQEEG